MGSRSEINVNEYIRERIAVRFRKGNVKSSVFNEAVVEVIDLIAVDALPRFLRNNFKEARARPSFFRSMARGSKLGTGGRGTKNRLRPGGESARS